MYHKIQVRGQEDCFVALLLAMTEDYEVLRCQPYTKAAKRQGNCEESCACGTTKQSLIRAIRLS